MNREERENDVLEQLLRESLASDAEPAGDFTARLMEQVHRTPQDKARKQPYQKILAALAACAVIAAAIPLVMPRASNQAATSADSAAPEMWEEANGADTADDRLYSIPGSPPNLLHEPVGDAFAARNQFALVIDKKADPPLFKVSETHYAATWLLHPDAPAIEMPRELRERLERAQKEAARYQ